MPNENLLFRTRPHPILLMAHIMLVLLFFAPLRIISPPVPAWVSFALPLVAIVVFVLDYLTTIYEATTEAVTKRQGLVWLREERISTREIQDLKLSTGFLGLVFGFGRLEIESAGTEGEIVLSALPMSAFRVLRPLRRARNNVRS